MAKLFFFFMLTSLFSRSLGSAAPSSQLPKDLGDACQNIWNAAGNNLRVPSELTVDMVGKNPLFTVIGTGQGKLNSDVFRLFGALLQDNVEANQEAFLNSIIQRGGPIEQALNYLNAHESLGQDLATFKETLKELWFILPRGKETKGFLHVFCGEVGQLKKHYEGFHNWFQFYRLQTTTNELTNVEVASVTYDTEPTFMQGLDFTWDVAKKRGGGSSLFVGTSPAFDFAIFSVCALSIFKPPNQLTECSCQIHKTILRITAKEISVKEKKVMTPKGKVNTAYPSAVIADPMCTSVDPNTRTNCGTAGIDEHTCGERGCCFDWQQYTAQTHMCFYPANHECHVAPPHTKVDCGSPPGITRIQCEQEKNCCFDESPAQGAPKCYQKVPKETK